MNQLEKTKEEFEVGRIEFEDRTFKREDDTFYIRISEKRIREIIREELADIEQRKHKES